MDLTRFLSWSIITDVQSIKGFNGRKTIQGKGFCFPIIVSVVDAGYDATVIRDHPKAVSTSQTGSKNYRDHRHY
jgi:hypothetical protein